MGWRLKTSLGVIFSVTMAAFMVRLLLVEDYRISSESMVPNLLDGDFIFISKFNFNIHFPFSSYEFFRLRRPNRGELALFSLPDHGSASFVKRVVASEGDRVAILNGVLSVNGVNATYRPVDGSDEVFLESIPGQESFEVKWDKTKIENYGPVDVPPGYFFALGDNRMDNNDSRAWGPIPYACLKGKPVMVWFSVEPDGTRRKHRLGVWVRS